MILKNKNKTPKERKRPRKFKYSKDSQIYDF